MQQALLVRLRPLGPWRYGPSDGALDSVDMLFRSDRLFSALTLAMRQLGMLDGWLDATARAAKPAVAFTSLFPFQGDTLFVTPPAHLWPPPSSLVTSPSPVFLTKIRWRAARLVPLSLMDSLLTGQPVLADQWIPDPESGCLLRRDRPSSSPFRTVARAFAPVDRLRLTASDAHASACVEFEPGSGLWTAIRFADEAGEEAWAEPLKAAFRLLGDSGFGGGRSKGWGQVQPPEFESGAWPGLILPKVGRSAKNDVHQEQTSRSYWLMSLYSPSAHDTVNWSAGQYELTIRNGRVDGASGVLKKSVRMVVEGCVLDAASEPVGTAVDVAPEGFAHPVYRSGIALALLIPPPKPQSEDRRPIETIVPPELEATPFPVPATEPDIAEPAPPSSEAPTPVDEREIALPSSIPVHQLEAAPQEAEPVHKPEPAPQEFAPVDEPEPTPQEFTPVHEPEPALPESTPVDEPEPTPQEAAPLHEAEPAPQEFAPVDEPEPDAHPTPSESEPVADSVSGPEPAPLPVTEPEPEPAPLEDPQENPREDPAPVDEPGPEPVPVGDPEEPIPQEEPSSLEPSHHKEEGYEL
jgi:CRISPR/Cas system CSM-associated protein Csm4 (group 5 of RAMP superfamily)